jgi:SAM-dependent methyltransferase
MPSSNRPAVLAVLPKTRRDEPVGTECVLRCPDHHVHLEVSDNQGAAKTVLVRCNRCDLCFEEPRPPKAAIDAFYNDVALWTNSTDAEGKQRSYVRELQAKEPLFRSLARRIERYRVGGRLLDVGCGPGLLERVLDTARWQVTGIEMSPYIADFGRTQLETNVITGRFEELDLPADSFDVVVMKYVLDHMEEPFEALLKARRVLKADGLLVVADLINIESFCARWFADGFRLIHPMHFTYFSPRTIALHLERAGFSVTRIEYPYFGTPYCTFSGLSTLAWRVLRRLVLRFSGSRQPVYSPPFYGNMMDVWAVPPRV